MARKLDSAIFYQVILCTSRSSIHVNLPVGEKIPFVVGGIATLDRDSTMIYIGAQEIPQLGYSIFLCLFRIM